MDDINGVFPADNGGWTISVAVFVYIYLPWYNKAISPVVLSMYTQLTTSHILCAVNQFRHKYRSADIGQLHLGIIPSSILTITHVIDPPLC